MSRFGNWARHVDDVVLGRPVKDDRPLIRRMLVGDWEIWSPRTRRWCVGVAVAMVAVIALSRWLDDPLVGVICVLCLCVVEFLVLAADGRRRAREDDLRRGD